MVSIMSPFTAGETASGITQIGGWLDPRAGEERVAKRKTFQSTTVIQ
jgi:hypothetical protein